MASYSFLWFFFSHSIFDAVYPGSMGLPTSSITFSLPPKASSISLHSWAVEVSHQSFTFHSTSPSFPRGTKPCCWPETDRASMFFFTSPSMEEKHFRRASRYHSVFCSLDPSGREIRSRGQEETQTSPFSKLSYTKTLIDCVPRSIPATSILFLQCSP